jgi:hypothetical protein
MKSSKLLQRCIHSFLMMTSIAIFQASSEEISMSSWVAPPSLVDKLEARDLERGRVTNFREENIPAYKLPELLELAAGGKVLDAVTWREQRRPEIIELFKKHAYGRAPLNRPEGITFKIHNLDRHSMGGEATRKQVEINFSGTGKSLKMNQIIFIPNQFEGPAPGFLLISHRDRSNLDPTREKKTGFWPAEDLVARGYTAITFCAGDLDDDEFDEFKDLIHAQFDGPGPRQPDAWGTLAAWAWGASRAMDYLETDDDIDHQRIGVVGHSRGGKASLWAGALDERFALVVSNSSGCGGAALSRRKIGNPVDILNRKNPHWYCENYKQFDSKEETMPFDQHMLLALAAPRLLYIASASEDLWADPRGEFLAAVNAEPAYHLLGVKGLETEHMPAVESPVHIGRIGYHIRGGEHDLKQYDWQRYMDFADKHWKKN